MGENKSAFDLWYQRNEILLHELNFLCPSFTFNVDDRNTLDENISRNKTTAQSRKKMSFSQELMYRVLVIG